MRLYLMRHGIAEENSPSGMDRDRALTPEGSEKIRTSAQALKGLGFHVDLILTSPYKRARQTAEILAQTLGFQFREEHTLASGARLENILRELDSWSGQIESLLLVGHEPILSQLISIGISGDAGLSITMGKGGLCRLTCGSPFAGSASLDWLLSPHHLLRM